MNLSIDLMISSISVILLLIIVIFITLKDKEVERKIKNIEIAIDEILKERHKNNKVINSLISSNNTDIDSLNANIQESINLILDEKIKHGLKAELKEYVKIEIDKAIAPVLSNLHNIEEDIKDFQFDQQDRMAILEQKNKQADRLSMMSQNEEEQKVLNLHDKGYSVEQIARELGITSGKAEFIIKLNTKQ